MIGFYIITRMISLMRNDKNTALRIVAGVTIAVTIFCMLDIFVKGATTRIPGF